MSRPQETEEQYVRGVVLGFRYALADPPRQAVNNDLAEARSELDRAIDLDVLVGIGREPVEAIVNGEVVATQFTKRSDDLGGGYRMDPAVRVPAGGHVQLCLKSSSVLYGGSPNAFSAFGRAMFNRPIEPLFPSEGT